MPGKVEIDQHGIARVDGEPFFLIGARHLPEGGTPEMLRDAGFNAFRFLAFGHENKDPEPLPGDLEGIYFWAYIFDRADLTKSPEYEPQLRARVAELRRHPALLGYENYNEPTLLYKSDQFKTRPEDLARGTAVLRALDPDHPIWLAHACTNTIETLRRFNPSTDIVGCNPYPLYVPGMRSHIGVREDGRMLDCLDQSIHAVGRYTDKMMAVGQGRMPVWMLIQAMANEHWFSPVHTPEMAAEGLDESKILYPTLAQMRFMAWDAIVSGATGLALAMNKTPTRGPVWEDIKTLVGELRGLHQALAAPPLAGLIQVEYADLGFTIWDGVRTRARRCDREIYLFAANTAFDPAEVSMRLPADIGSAALVVGEDRELPVENRVVRDYFEPYGVHIYRLQTA